MVAGGVFSLQVFVCHTNARWRSITAQETRILPYICNVVRIRRRSWRDPQGKRCHKMIYNALKEPCFFKTSPKVVYFHHSAVAFDGEQTKLAICSPYFHYFSGTGLTPIGRWRGEYWGMIASPSATAVPVFAVIPSLLWSSRWFRCNKNDQSLFQLNA